MHSTKMSTRINRFQRGEYHVSLRTFLRSYLSNNLDRGVMEAVSVGLPTIQQNVT